MTNRKMRRTRSKVSVAPLMAFKATERTRGSSAMTRLSVRNHSGITTSNRFVTFLGSKFQRNS
jgi:hypothetical protein